MAIKEFFAIFKDSANSFEGQREGESILILIRRHPFTILVRIGFLGLALLAPIIVGIVFFSYLSEQGWLKLFFFASSLWYLGFWLAIFHALTIYTLSTVIITDQRIVDSDQHGLFNRKISELNNNRIQDVSTHTNGIIETFLKFGDVNVQTAASERQFVFHQVPRPNKIKELIMQITTSRHTGIKPSD